MPAHLDRPSASLGLELFQRVFPQTLPKPIQNRNTSHLPAIPIACSDLLLLASGGTQEAITSVHIDLSLEEFPSSFQLPHSPTPKGSKSQDIPGRSDPGPGSP